MSKAFPVRGLKELDLYLSALPKRLQTGAYDAGLRAAAKPVTEKARELASKRSGKMARSIATGSPKQNRDGTISIRVRADPKKEHSFLAYFLEFGVRPHLITISDADAAHVEGRLKPLKSGRARSRKTLVGYANKWEAEGSLVINEQFVGDVIRHPGHAAHPFLRPALDLMGDEAVKAFAVKIREYLEKKTGFAAPLPEAA